MDRELKFPPRPLCTPLLVSYIHNLTRITEMESVRLYQGSCLNVPQSLLDEGIEELAFWLCGGLWHWGLTMSFYNQPEITPWPISPLWRTQEIWRHDRLSVCFQIAQWVKVGVDSRDVQEQVNKNTFSKHLASRLSQYLKCLNNSMGK